MGEYEPDDSRIVTGAVPSKEKPTQRENSKAGRGEYEPEDSRDVTGAQPPANDRGDKTSDQ